MISFIFESIYPLHYTDHLARSGKIAGAIMLILGSIILFRGIYNIFIHIRRNKLQYSVVPGKITGSEKVVRTVRHSTRTDYYPILEFEYGGEKYNVRSPRALGVETMTAFSLASEKGSVEIRVPVGKPDEAYLNYELSRNEKLYAGLKVCILGVILILTGVFFRLK